jgi:hypothetical protein
MAGILLGIFDKKIYRTTYTITAVVFVPFIGKGC